MKKKDRLPKLQNIYLSIETNEGTTDCNWSADKKTQKLFGMESYPLTWFKRSLRQSKQHYPEGMGS